MVDYKVQENLAILEINNPPVNALSIHVREGITNGIKQANSDNSVDAVIIIGRGRTFPCGADIKEFGHLYLKEPILPEVVKTIENSQKPVISAIHGDALGGGLEIALGSHYRIADKNAKVGFPEVLIGVIPAAQGSIRLPRVAGLAFSMDFISSGKSIDAPQALEHGILDKLCDGNLFEAAKNYAKEVIGQPLDPRRLSKSPVTDKADVDRLYEKALVEVKKKYKGQVAPIHCLQSVRNAAKMPFQQAVAEERRISDNAMSGLQGAAMQYSFFADRSAPRWRLPNGASISNTKPEKIKSTGVIGAGTMGSGISLCLIQAGIPVILVEKDPKVLDKALKTIAGILSESVKLKRLTPHQREVCLGLIKGASSLNELGDVDLVIEAVFEDLRLKRQIFSQLDKICKPSTILCTNTSTLDIDKIASATKRPDKVVGTHFFAPAYIMRLLENVYGTKTSASTVATVMELGKQIGKISVLVRTCFGFVANRMNQQMGLEASFMLEEGALPQEIDEVLENFGMSMGIFRVSDLSGIDVGWKIRQELAKSLGVTLNLETRSIFGERISTVADRLYHMGRYGVKSGKGWYKYSSPNSRKAVPDEEVTDMIKYHCKVMGFERRKITPHEILDRCLLSAVNEGFKILDERVADKPEDIDVIWQHGLAFPRYAGGPMFYASTVGLKKVYEKICKYQEQFPHSSHWVPSGLLKKLASHSADIPIAKWTQFIGGSKL